MASIPSLNYSIHSSSASTAFQAENIKIDSPFNSRSRWTGNFLNNSKDGTYPITKENPRGSPPSSSSTTVTNEKQQGQFVTLKLEKESVIRAIGFGKFHKAHPCNLSEFVVSSGITADPRHMKVLFRGGLKNDNVNERFDLTRKDVSEDDNMVIPIKYVRIDSLATHAPNYNVTIWHVWLEGMECTKAVITKYDEYRSSRSAHFILAHLRRSHLFSAFSSLLSTLPTSIATSFEHPLVAKLHEALVIQGDFAGENGAEVILARCIEEKLLLKQTAPYQSIWSRLFPTSLPSPRAGHQLIKLGRTLYLYGGFDGKDELGDLWSWELPRKGDKNFEKSPWRQIESTEDESLILDKTVKRKRPRSRSCHQLAVDESSGWIYLLGGYRAPPPILETPVTTSRAIYTYAPDEDVTMTSGSSNIEPQSILGSLISMDDFPDRMSTPAITSMETDSSPTMNYDDSNLYASDFWRFKPARGSNPPVWELISKDTSLEFGPALLSDHQMCIDSESQTLFVFGGRVNEPASPLVKQVKRYSGFYTYDLVNKKWRCEFGDRLSHLTAGLESRVGHSMVFDSTTRLLHIFSGERDTRVCHDAWTIGPIPLTLSTPINFLSLATLLPTSIPTTFTQRFNCDSDRNTWLAWSGFVDQYDRDELINSNGRSTSLCHDIWRGTPASSSQKIDWEKVDNPQVGGPVPRFAAPMVYDALNETHYIFGGNPGEAGIGEVRLGDFWSLALERPSSDEARRQATFLIRKQKFDEMCQVESALDALVYLQTQLSAVVDHSNEVESNSFRSCLDSLLSAPPQLSMTLDDSDDESDDVRSKKRVVIPPTISRQEARSRVFIELLNFFGEKVTQPREALVDVVCA